MQLSVLVFTPLILNVVTNGGFCTMLSNCTDIVSITPELAAPQFLLYRRNSCKDFTRGQALDDLHDPGWTIAWHRLHQKMHMIPIGTNFYEYNVIALCNVQAHRFQDLIHFFTGDDSSVFGGTHDMV